MTHSPSQLEKRLNLLKEVWRMMSGERRRYATAILFLVAGSAFGLMIPFAARYVLDGLEDSTLTLTGTAVAVLSTVVLSLLQGICHFKKGVLGAQSSESICRNLRLRLYNHLNRVSLKWHDTQSTGDLVQRCTSDVETFRQFLASDIVTIGHALILVSLASPLLFWVNIELALISLLLAPVIAGISVLSFRMIAGSFLAVDESEGDLTTGIQENLSGIRVVRAFARQDYEIEKFSALNKAYRNARVKLIRLLAHVWGCLDGLYFLQQAITLGWGAAMVSQGEISLGDLFVAWVIVRQVYNPIKQLGRVLADVGKAEVSLGRIVEVMGQSRETESGHNLRQARRGHLVVENLSFGYQPGQLILKGISFEVKPGETLGIVGATGSGKSTLIQLLLKLRTKSGGRIFINGEDTSTVSLASVREQFGVVLQEPFLFSRSVEANIRHSRPSADFEEIVIAARQAAIHEAILGFDRGYDTEVGEKGVSLSGGQQQRVALARALLKDAPFLVLDDALSAVDARTEKVILEGLLERRHRQTTLIVAHRLALLRHADKIIVIDDGQLIQEGRHEELVRQEGKYREIWTQQEESGIHGH